MKSAACALVLALMLLLPFAAMAEALTPEQMLAAEEANMIPMTYEELVAEPDDGADTPAEPTAEPTPEPTAEPKADPAAREAFINDIIALAEKLYDEAGGRAMKAADSSDIYICKNFTTYIFRKTRDKYRMAEFPDTGLIIPNNQPKENCKPYVYGVEWEDVPASEGNPFYAVAEFRYNNDLSMEENKQLAHEFLTQVQRGDYFQMAADYYYGIGAHSMIFISDYDPETDTVHWTDSNMKGKRIEGVRYAYVQFDAVKDIDWFVDAFCHKRYGATIYRLRDDIMFAE